MLTSTDSVDLNGQPFKLYPERWVTLAHFFVLQMTNSLMWVTFAPIADITAEYFGPGKFVGSLAAVNLLAVLFLLLYPAGTVIASMTKKLYGLRVSLLIAAVFTALGALLRFIGVYIRNDIGGTWAYALVFIGTIFVSIIQPIYINYPPTVSAIWFPLAERDIATAIGSMSNPVGNAIGTLIPVFIVHRTTNPVTNEDVVHGMPTLMLVEFLAVLVPLIVAWFSLMDSPPTPPSHSASLKITELSVHSSSALQSASSLYTSENSQASSSFFTSSTATSGKAKRGDVGKAENSSSQANPILSDVDFEHSLEDDVTSFAPSLATDASISNHPSSHEFAGVANPSTNNNSVRESQINSNGRQTISGGNRLSSYFDGSRFSIFARADQGPRRHRKGSVWFDIRCLFQNRHFVILVTTMAFLLGMFSAFLTVLYQLISHYNYSNRQAGILGFVIIISGLLGTVVVGYVMKRTRAYRSLLQGIVIAAVLFFIVTMCVMVENQFVGLVICSILLGVTMLPVLPVMMENCAEIAYPISEEIATGVVFSVKLFMGAIIIAAAIIVLFYNGEYRRLERDLSKKERAVVRTNTTTNGESTADEEDGMRQSRAASLGERLFHQLRKNSIRKSRSNTMADVEYNYEEDMKIAEESKLRSSNPSTYKAYDQYPTSASNSIAAPMSQSLPNNLSFLTNATITGTEDTVSITARMSSSIVDNSQLPPQQHKNIQSYPHHDEERATHTNSLADALEDGEEIDLSDPKDSNVELGNDDMGEVISPMATTFV